MMQMIELAAGNYRLVLEPERGGSIARFDWRGEPLMRPTCGPSILDTACFPLVPFSNRIAHGRFEVNGREVVLAPNMPGSDHPHPLHGFGWLAAWDVVEHSLNHAVLRHRHRAGEWPWDYEAEQTFSLSPKGLRHELSVRNLSDTPMPAGLGFHPYFPRDADTLYRGLHRGEWQSADDSLPQALYEQEQPVDWWQGRPVGSRTVDTVYMEREGDLSIIWPERELALAIQPSIGLPDTVAFTPAGADFFCIEPVSHATNTINGPDGMSNLSRDETLAVAVHYAACERGSKYPPNI